MIVPRFPFASNHHSVVLDNSMNPPKDQFRTTPACSIPQWETESAQLKLESDILLPIFHIAQRRGFWELEPPTWRKVALEFQNCGLIAWEKSAPLCMPLKRLISRKMTQPWGDCDVRCGKLVSALMSSTLPYLLWMLSCQRALTSYRSKNYSQPTNEW